MTVLSEEYVPRDFFYSKSHIWASVEESSVTFGITEFCLNQIGEVMYVDLPEVGDKCLINFSCGSLESVRHIIDLELPLNCLIFEINKDIVKTPALINDDPYGKGWLLRAEFEHDRELAQLLRHKEYLKYITSNF